MYYKFSLIIVLFLFTFCTEEYFVPKERGYYRVILPNPKYQKSNLKLPFHFEYSKYSKIKTNKENFFTIYYPNINAEIYFSYYKNAPDSLAYYIEDFKRIAMKHIPKASDIEESLIKDKEENVYGVFYNFYGPTASNIQFFLTDSTNNFFRAALYFRSIPNTDSLKPFKEFVKNDILHLIETFHWK